jgi:hypothetical protein
MPPAHLMYKLHQYLITHSCTYYIGAQAHYREEGLDGDLVDLLSLWLHDHLVSV